MMTLKEQENRYKKNWTKFSKLFETKLQVEDPVPLYAIGIHLHPTLHERMRELSYELQTFYNPKNPEKDIWLKSKHMHITLELPGRLGKQFKSSDLPMIEEKLKDLATQTPKFQVKLRNLNCFPSVLFREVLDGDGNLYDLHNKIAQAIPFSEHPEYRFENFVPHMSLCYLGGGGHRNILQNSNFKRALDTIEMPVEKIYFLKATNEDYGYHEEILAECHLS